MSNEILIGLIFVVVIVVVCGAYLWKTYNRLVNLRINAERQASHVQVYLKKKYDLIPALASAVAGYMSHERGTLEEVTRLRSQWGAAKSVDEKMRASNQLESALARLLIVQERYPNLKADRAFQNIMRSMTIIEIELTRERKVYNKRVSWYNVKLQEFPSSAVANMFGFTEKEFYGTPNSTLE